MNKKSKEELTKEIEIKKEEIESKRGDIVSKKEEIETIKKEITAIENQIEENEKYESYRKAADETVLMKRAFVESGYDEDEAFELIKTMFKQALTPKPQLGGIWSGR